MHKNILAAFLLIFLISSSIYFIRHLKTNTLAEENQSHVDSYMKNAIYDQYNAEGQLTLHITSPLSRHYSLSNRNEFEKPDIIIYQGQEAPWHITAVHGKSLQDNKLIDLWDDVVIHRATNGENPETTIRTTVLSIDPKAQIAETNQAATITQPHSVIQSIGLKTDFKSGISQLSTNARVVYEGEISP